MWTPLWRRQERNFKTVRLPFGAALLGGNSNVIIFPHNTGITTTDLSLNNSQFRALFGAALLAY